MVNVIGIKFQNNGKIYYFDAGSSDIHVGQYVIVDTAQGADLAEVVMGCREMEEESLSTPLKSIIRVATAQDIQHATDNRMKEREAYTICQRKIAEHQLEMKLVSVEYTFDNSKILFYFTANGRVDFRALVKDLASVFKTRIELRQIGVRDEARMLGGLGPCGRQICCGAFLNEFQPVSIKMAKEQSLSLNPTKISGVCGRLMCCLKYEQDHYEQTRKMMPRIGRDVTTPDGQGTVTALNIVKETVTVRIAKGDEFEVREYPLDTLSHDGIPFALSKTDDPQTDSEETNLTDTDITDENPEIEEELTGIQQEKEAGPQDKRKIRNSEKGHRERHEGHNRGKNLQTREEDGQKPVENNRRPTENGHKPGEPVRRVNPNRKPFVQGSEQAKDPNTESVSPQISEQKQDLLSEIPKAPTKQSSWADALEKAMRAADGNS